MVVVHCLPHPRLLVFCRRVVVPTVVALPATGSYLSVVRRDPRLVMLCYSYLVYTHIMSHLSLS